MTKTVSFLVAAAWLATLTLPATAAAGGLPRRHDGLFLRASGGFGPVHTQIDDPTIALDFSGRAFDANVALGYMVAPNLAVHGTLFGWTTFNPDAEIALNGVITATEELEGHVQMAALGVGATYYMVPANLYVSGTLGMGRLDFDGEDETGAPVEGNTDLGLAFDLTVGQEWWVGDQWGLGVAGGFIYHSLPDSEIDETWTGSAFTVRFTATMN